MMKETVTLEKAGLGVVQGIVFVPKTPIKGYLQIICDMYDELARYECVMEKLSKEGYLVFGCNLPGHGRSATTLGDMQGATGSDLIQILHEYYQLVLRRYPAVMEHCSVVSQEGKKLELIEPILHALLGIGFGCALARSYLVHYKDVNSLIFVGDPGMNARYPKLLKQCQKECRQKGEKASSAVIREEMQKHWLDLSPLMKKYARNTYRSRELRRVRSYAQSETLNFDYDLASMQTILSVLSEITMSQWLSLLPKYMPLYEMCGYLDPINNYTREIDEMLTRFRYSACKNIFYSYYENSRHDLLLESCQKEVLSDIALFMNRINDSLKQMYASQKRMILDRKEGKS